MNVTTFKPSPSQRIDPVHYKISFQAEYIIMCNCHGCIRKKQVEFVHFYR